MLHPNTIDQTMHRVLLSMLSKEYLNDFSLVGRTSLSIGYGHRKSVAIYLFSPSPFEPSLVDGLLKTDYSHYVYKENNRYMLFCDIGLVKTGIIHHPFAGLSPVEIIAKVRMFSIRDVAAMKLSAICNRRRKKDFCDVWALLQHFTSSQLADFVIEKYGEEKLIFLKKSIVYFEQADNDIELPEIPVKKLTRNKVKEIEYKSFISL
jgi:hypothetical protein